MTLDRLRDALEALGPPVTPLELAEMLWLAERLPVGEGGGAGASASVLHGGDHVDFREGTFHGPVTGSLGYGDRSKRGEGSDEGAERLDPAEPESDAGPRLDPGRRALHVPRGAPSPGTDADDVLVPAPGALRHELAIQRALRPLKRRVPDRRRRTLDEEATAARAARHSGLRPWAPVMVPVADRLLSLALVVDTGPAMTVWRPLARELREALQRTAAFRDVRVWQLADIGSRVGVRISAAGPALDPAALVDPTGRQIVLVLSDCSGPHWWGGRAAPALHLWAGRGPTALLQPLPERLWRRTAAPAVPGRAIASRAGAPNTALRFTPHDGRAGLPAPDAIPVPVLELAPEWLADWAGLVTASGDRRRDTAVTYVSRSHPPHAQPLSNESDLPVTERILRFQAAASPTAADLAAHVALSVPALPVMRLIQQRVTPGSRPSDLAEVLLSGLLEPVEAERGLYDFVPGARAALLETLPRPESLAVAELLGRLGAEIEARAGSGTRAFRAVVPVAEGAGSRGLGEAGQPFALVSEEALGVLRGRAIRVVERPAVTSTDTETWNLALEEEPVPSEAARFEPPGSVTAPAGFSNVTVADPVIGRAHELDGLDRTFTDIHGAERVVLHGTAGVGKSMLARAWAGRWGARDQEPPVWWVKADSPASLIRGISGLTDALQPSVTDPRATGGRWEWALQWLSSHTGWALVLDGVRKPAHVRVLLSRLGHAGAVLITSREADGWPDDTLRLGLDVPALSDVVQMFKVRAGREVAGVVRLCEELGRLPSAVVRAAETIAAMGMTVDEYLSGAVGEAQASLAEGPAPTGAPVEEPADADGDAIRESLRTVHDPMSLQLLLTLAWLGTAPVPVETLVTGLSERCDVPRGLADLAERGLIRSDPEADQVVLPGLVGTVARTPDKSLPYRSQGTIDAARDWAVVCLSRSFPRPADEPMHWTRCRLLLPLVEGLCARTASEKDTGPVADLLVDAARFLVSQGEFEWAIDLLHRALSCRRRLAGGDSPEAVEAMAALAKAHLAAGRATEAIALYKDAQDALRGGAWGSDGLDALELRGGLADAYAGSGDPIRALRELEAVSTDAAEILGPRHPGRLRLWSRLARMHARVGRFADAVAHYEDLLAACRSALSADDLETLAVQRDLAFAHAAAGHADRAVAELKQVVATLARLLGSGHPRTAAAQSDLADLYRARDNVKLAVKTYKRALAASRSTLGAEHPQTLGVRERLGATLLTDGSAARAVPLFEEVLSVRGALFGEGHPDTLRVADSLAAAYGDVGRRDQQVALYERTLAIRRELLGDGDLETLRSYVRLATITGADDKSVEAQARAHAGRVRTLGEDHPDTLLTLEWLALARIKAGDTDLGLEQLGNALTLRCDTLGPAHADALRVMGHLAQAHLDRGEAGHALEVYVKVSSHAQHARGDVRAAITVLERAHAHLTSALGPTHTVVKALEKRLARPR